MSQNGEAQPLARRNDLVVSELPNEVLVYDLKQHKAHCLNQTAAQIWNLSDGNTSVPEIARILSREHNKQVNEDVIWLALRQLGNADLLAKQLPVPEDIMVSRRKIVRQLGLGSLLIPAVMTIITPTVVMAATCVPNAGGCTPNNGNCSVSTTCCSCCCVAGPGQDKCGNSGPGVTCQ
ncbi:MAG TPA: PqqD family protein [Blastocatellia bacterium]|nr:PqqD family protein [Blastocatellia bacterium]